MGIALDKEFEKNPYVYVMYTYEEMGVLKNAVARLVKKNQKLEWDKILIDNIPGGRIHNGGRIKIGPDGKLYITTGDTGKSELAQDLSSLAGKILRINLDGSIPMDNPFEGSPIYSYGLRNPQGLAWDQEGNLYASDHGLRAHDEINRIIPGGNYGWPLVQGDETVEGMDIQVPLIHSMDVTWAPSGIDFVKEGPWEGRLLVTNLRGEQLLEVAITETEEGVSKAYAQPWLVSKYGRLRDVVSAKDGFIYIATNNRDGRGNPRIGDDRILRLVLRID